MTKNQKEPTTQQGQQGNTLLETKVDGYDFRGERERPSDDYDRVAPPLDGQLDQVLFDGATDLHKWKLIISTLFAIGA